MLHFLEIALQFEQLNIQIKEHKLKREYLLAL